MRSPSRDLLLFLFATVTVSSPLGYGQRLLSSGGPVHLFPSDLAILETGEPRKDFGCTVTSPKPILGFDLKYHSSYEVMIPLKELEGAENLLTILFRVTSQETKGEPIYFTQRVRVPAIEEDAKGEAYLQGTFDVGEGKYHVDWLMRDRSERVCAQSWDVEASLPPKDKAVELMIPPSTIQMAEGEQFKEEPPVARLQTEPPLNLKVLVNFAPQNARSTTLQPLDTSALLAILRSIARDPRVGKFSLVAFNLHEQRVIFRQDNADKIDFPKLGESLQSVNLGTVDLKRLGQKHGDTDFLTDLIRRETTESAPDALVFAGPKAMLDENIPPESLKEVGSLNYPVFYMNYNLYPQAVPWRDSISHAVKYFRGYEFTISRPRDLWYAVSDMVSRIVKWKGSRLTPAAHSE